MTNDVKGMISQRSTSEASTRRPNQPLRQVHLVDLTSIAGACYSPTLGYLQAAAEADPDVSTRCSFTRHVLLSRKPFFERACEQVMASLDDPLVVAFTIYFWNRKWSLELARRIKRAWPNCWIVVGGNDVSYQQRALFAEAPWVDVLVHGDGELRFVELLKSLLHETGGLPSIDGISYWQCTGGERTVVSTTAPARIADLSAVPSQLSVYADHELASTSLLVYETNRGCPYGCAFCYWGGATNAKVRQFPLERIKADLDRIIRLVGPHTLVALADANFGMLPRDVEIARHLVDACSHYGKTVDLFVSWAKNCNKRIVETARLLHGAGLITPVTLSAQSFSPTVLDLANRTNIRPDNFRKLQTQFRELRIPTYTDIIWGMPGETYGSFLSGIEETLAAGGSPIIYPLVLLNNTDYTRETFRQDQRIAVKHLPVDVSDPEMTGDLVVSHAAMTEGEWLRGLEFRLCLYLVQKSLMRCTLRLLHTVTGTRMVDLCDRLRAVLFDGDPDRVGLLGPAAHAIARNYRDSWTDPDQIDRALLAQELGIELGSGEIYGRQETHFEALLHSLVKDPHQLARFVDGSTEFLLATVDQSSHPDRHLLRGARDLDLAAGAVFQSMITGTPEHTGFHGPADLLRLLGEAGDLPADLSLPAHGEATGRVNVPADFLAADFHAPQSFSRYVAMVWRGLLTPLRDLVIERSGSASEDVPAGEGRRELAEPRPRRGQ